MFLLVLPFTFLPALFRHGISWSVIAQRVQASALYATLIATGIILIALLNNYEKLLQKKRIYELPAFTALNFSGAVEGYNSIIKELSTYLFGKAGNYFFRVNVLNPASQELIIEISPLIYVGQDASLLERLILELGLKENLYLSRILRLTEEQLQEQDILQREVTKLAEELALLNVQPLTLEDNSLHLI